MEHDHELRFAEDDRGVRGDPCGDPPLRTAGRLRALLAGRDAR
jgi:hypothetical protein